MNIDVSGLRDLFIMYIYVLNRIFDAYFHASQIFEELNIPLPLDTEKTR